MPWRKAAPATLAGLLWCAGCGGSLVLPYDQPNAPETAVHSSSGGDSWAPTPLVPRSSPTGPVVLTIKGKASPPEVEARVEIDLAAMRTLDMVTVELIEPLVDEAKQFTGVSAEQFLAAVGVAPDTHLSWIALDEYMVEFTRAELAAENAILAIEQDGKPIAVEDGGPVRVVFPNRDGPLSSDPNQWIWSLKTIEAR